MDLCWRDVRLSIDDFRSHNDMIQDHQLKIRWAGVEKQWVSQ